MKVNTKMYLQSFIWTCQLHRLLHATSHFLNLEFYYSNSEMEYDLEVTNRFYTYIKRLMPSKYIQQFFFN